MSSSGWPSARSTGSGEQHLERLLGCRPAAGRDLPLAAMILPEIGLWQLAKVTAKRISENAVTDRAAQLSYYFLFSLFPFLFTLVTLAAYLPVQGAIDQLMARLDPRSEEHTSELQSRLHLVCRLLLEKK